MEETGDPWGIPFSTCFMDPLVPSRQKALLWASDLYILSVTPGFLGAVFLEDILAQLIFASDILT
jgi:hypothetical protein